MFSKTLVTGRQISKTLRNELIFALCIIFLDTNIPKIPGGSLWYQSDDAHLQFSGEVRQ